jgi:hypothetical protein
MSSVHDQIIAAETEQQVILARIEKLRKIEEVLQDPEAEAVIRKALGIVAESPGMRVTVSGGVTAYDRLRDWFAGRGNEPATIADMASTAGVSVSAIRQVVYRSRAEAFENVGRGETRETRFRLKTNGEALRGVE